MTESRTINIGKQYSRFPVGRKRTDGDSNGVKFRDDVLIPALRLHQVVVLEFDDALGYGSSFLEETFGGLVRSGFTEQDLARRLKLVTSDSSLLEEIRSYVRDEQKRLHG